MGVDETIIEYEAKKEVRQFRLENKNEFFPSYKKLNSLKEVKKTLIYQEQLQDIDFFMNLGFEEEKIVDILMYNTNKDFQKLYEDGILKKVK